MANLRELQEQWNALAEQRAALKEKILAVKSQAMTLEWQAENPFEAPERKEQFLVEAAALRGDA